MDVRRIVCYSGRVQGVGFRFSTEKLARGFEITGTVQNLSDGRVKLVAQGNAQEVDRFLLALSQVMDRNIQDCQSEEVPPCEAIEDFRIVY